MPFVSPTSNRVLPGNVRAADVAKTAINRVLDAQRLKNHAAFVPQGYPVCVYHRLTSGIRCHCQNRVRATKTRLGEDGTASPALLNELLTGSSFGVRPYRQDPQPKTTLFHIDQSKVSSMYDDDVSTGVNRVATSMDPLATDQPYNAGTIIEDGVGARGPVASTEPESLIDSELLGVTDYYCPICLGIGFVGGVSVTSGIRFVLCHQTPGLRLPATAVVRVENQVPVIETTEATFSLVLGKGAEFVDAFRVWNNRVPAAADVFVDNRRLTSADSVLHFFDGRMHDIRIVPHDGKFTHVELQVGQSSTTDLIDFPKVSRSTISELLDSLDDIQLIASPLVPLLRPGDYISDGVHGKVYLIKSCSGQHDRSRTVLGWECDVRVLQPQEVASQLPRRRAQDHAQPKSPSLRRDNVSGHHRT